MLRFSLKVHKACVYRHDCFYATAQQIDKCVEKDRKIIERVSTPAEATKFISPISQLPIKISQRHKRFLESSNYSWGYSKSQSNIDKRNPVLDKKEEKRVAYYYQEKELQGNDAVNKLTTQELNYLEPGLNFDFKKDASKTDKKSFFDQLEHEKEQQQKHFVADEKLRSRVYLKLGNESTDLDWKFTSNVHATTQFIHNECRQDLMKTIKVLNSVVRLTEFGHPISITVPVFNALLDVLFHHGQFAKGIALFAHMRVKKYFPLQTTFTVVINGLANANEHLHQTKNADKKLAQSVERLQHVECLLQIMEDYNVPISTIHYNALLKCYSRNRDIKKLMDLFLEMRSKDQVTYSITLSGLAWIMKEKLEELNHKLRNRNFKHEWKSIEDEKDQYVRDVWKDILYIWNESVKNKDQVISKKEGQKSEKQKHDTIMESLIRFLTCCRNTKSKECAMVGIWTLKSFLLFDTRSLVEIEEQFTKKIKAQTRLPDLDVTMLPQEIDIKRLEKIGGLPKTDLSKLPKAIDVFLDLCQHCQFDRMGLECLCQLVVAVPKLLVDEQIFSKVHLYSSHKDETLRLLAYRLIPELRKEEQISTSLSTAVDFPITRVARVNLMKLYRENNNLKGALSLWEQVKKHNSINNSNILLMILLQTVFQQQRPQLAFTLFLEADQSNYIAKNVWIHYVISKSQNPYDVKEGLQRRLDIHIKPEVRRVAEFPSTLLKFVLTILSSAKNRRMALNFKISNQKHKNIYKKDKYEENDICYRLDHSEQYETIEWYDEQRRIFSQRLSDVLQAESGKDVILDYSYDLQGAYNLQKEDEFEKEDVDHRTVVADFR